MLAPLHIFISPPLITMISIIKAMWLLDNAYDKQCGNNIRNSDSIRHFHVIQKHTIANHSGAYNMKTNTLCVSFHHSWIYWSIRLYKKFQFQHYIIWTISMNLTNSISNISKCSFWEVSDHLHGTIMPLYLYIISIVCGFRVTVLVISYQLQSYEQQLEFDRHPRIIRLCD